MNDNGPPDILQRTIAWCFGDDDEDPGLIAEEAAKRPDFLAWLDRYARDYAALKRAHTGTSEGQVGARLAALRVDVVQRREGAVDWTAAREDNVRSLDAARRRKIQRRTMWIGVAIAAAAAAILVIASSGSRAPDVDANVARVLVKDIVEDGMGFAGAAPSARDRGFLLGAVLDLSRPRKGAVADPELVLARDLADRALTGLDAPDDAEARRQRAMGGCAAILVTAAERAACERGFADYIARRDAYFSTR